MSAQYTLPYYAVLSLELEQSQYCQVKLPLSSCFLTDLVGAIWCDRLGQRNQTKIIIVFCIS